MAKNFYITTTLPYVNSDPHLGFAMELIRADVIARFKKTQGFDIFFNTGTDEHGLKIWQAAQKAGLPPTRAGGARAGQNIQSYCDARATRFRELVPALGILPEVNFIRTTDSRHERAAREFWKICHKAGYIYKKNYAIKYCVGCELEKTESELENGRCPVHPARELETIEEENYFFRFSDFQDKLLEFYKKTPDFVVPENRFREIKKFMESGLQDFSISRLKEKMPWGVEVPDDSSQVMYVWFDALTNYISALGWGTSPLLSKEGAGGGSLGEENLFEKFWVNGTPTQYCGKDNLRQQSAMWQAMLMAAGLPTSRQIVIDGFINISGQKMSKSVGNIADPFELVKEYSADAVRYFVLRELHPFEDSDYTPEKFKEAYNANLANGLGNLVSRIMKMAESALVAPVLEPLADNLPPEFSSALEKFETNKAADFVWNKIGKLDSEIQKTQPFSLIKTDAEKGREIIRNLILGLWNIIPMLQILLPDTAQLIKETIKLNKMPAESLFLRKE